MYLGRFRLDLIHPQPDMDADGVRDGEEFLARLRAFLTERVDPLEIERTGKLGDDVIAGLKDLGALGLKIPKDYGGLGLSQVYYNRVFELADLFCRQARRRADVLFDQLWANDDDAQFRVAQLVLEGRYAFFDAGILDPAHATPTAAAAARA